MENSEEHIWYDPHRKVWILSHDLIVYLPVDGVDATKQHTIKKGFESDLGSIKRVFWSFIAPFELGIIAVIVHDYLYRNGIGNRAWADWVFLYLMRQEHVPWWRRKSAYLAVRTFGWKAWNKYSKRHSDLSLPDEQ